MIDTRARFSLIVSHRLSGCKDSCSFAMIRLLDGGGVTIGPLGTKVEAFAALCKLYGVDHMPL